MLKWIGRQKGRGIAALVVISILTPPLSALLKPFVTEAIFGLLCIAFIRIDLIACKHYLKHPGVIISAVVWTSLAIPLGLLAFYSWMDIDTKQTDLFPGLALQAVASPMMATPAIVALMGLDATLILITLLFSTLLIPIIAPLLLALSGIELAIPPMQLGLHLAALTVGSLLIGIGLRKWIGSQKIADYDAQLDGVNILLLFVFISAVMGQLGIQILSDPLFILRLTVTTFAISCVLFITTYLLFMNNGRDRAFALALMTSQRNMGLMLAATGGLLPEMTWLFFAVSQFPIYFAPVLLAPLLKVSRKTDPA